MTGVRVVCTPSTGCQWQGSLLNNLLQRSTTAKVIATSEGTTAVTASIATSTTTTIETTTAELTSTAAGITSNCTHKFDYKVKGSVKSEVCLQDVALTWLDASNSCMKRGMRLYKMDTEESRKAMFSGAEVIYGTYTGSTLWVDGPDPLECAMVTNNLGSFDMWHAHCEIKMFSFCEKYVRVEGIKL